MKEYLYFTWNYRSHGGAKAALAMLKRCDLRREAKQDIDVEIDDPDQEPGEIPWTTGCSGCVKLLKEDPRVALLVAELKKVGIQPNPIVYRVFSKKERELAPWVHYAGYTTTVEAGGQTGQKWDFSDACKLCGAGAVPVPPLIAKVDRMPKQGWSSSVPDNLLIVSAAMGKALTAAKLTGFRLEALRIPSKETPDARFFWLRITSEWPTPSATPTCS